MKECRAQNVTCNGCGIKGHLKKCCKKSGNFPKDSNRQNQSSSTGSGKMNFASALPQTEADFFDEKGLLKEYSPAVQQHQQQQQYQQMGSMFVLRKIPIASLIPSSAPDPVPTPDFPFEEFPLTEVVTQSQIDPTVSTAPTQSSRDSGTISIPDNSTPRKSIPGIIPGIMADTPSTPTTFPVETDVTETPEAQLSNNRSVIPTDIQDLTVLQGLVSDDFQAKITPSTQRKGEDTHSTQRKGEDEAFQLIQKIHNQLQQVQWDLQRLHSLHKYKN